MTRRSRSTRRVGCARRVRTFPPRPDGAIFDCVGTTTHFVSNLAYNARRQGRLRACRGGGTEIRFLRRQTKVRRNMMKFYKCSICGKVMAQVSGPESGIVCCWMPMRELSLSREKRAVGAGDSRCGRDGASCVPPPRHEGAYFYAQSRRYL